MSVSSEDITTLKDHMDMVLEAVVQTYEQAGVELPEKRYIVFGQPVHDCEQVTVQFVQMYIGPPGDQGQIPQRCDGPRTAVLTVEVVRCIPTGLRGAAPSATAARSAAEQQAIDTWILLESTNAMDAYSGVLADIAVGEAQGGYQAVTMNVTAAVG